MKEGKIERSQLMRFITHSSLLGLLVFCFYMLCLLSSANAQYHEPQSETLSLSYNWKVKLTKLSLIPCSQDKDKPTSDLFFDKELYEMLLQSPDKPNIPGELVDCEFSGYVLSRQQVAEIALHKFKRRTSKLGLNGQQVTNALFTGKFNPYFKDLELAFEGVGFPTLKQLNEVWPFVEFDKQHLNSNLTYHKVVAYFGNRVDYWRRIQWNRNFGSVEKMPRGHYLGYNDVTADDLLLRNPIYGINHYYGRKAWTRAAFDSNNELRRCDEIRSLLRSKPYYLKEFEKALKSAAEYTDPVSFFKHSGSNNHSRNLAANYVRLRRYGDYGRSVNAIFAKTDTIDAFYGKPFRDKNPHSHVYETDSYRSQDDLKQYSMVVCKALGIPYKTDVKLHNLNPYSIYASVKYKTNAGTYKTMGWHKIKAGEQLHLSLEINEQDTDVLVYAETGYNNASHRRAYRLFNSPLAPLLWQGEDSGHKLYTGKLKNGVVIGANENGQVAKDLTFSMYRVPSKILIAKRKCDFYFEDQNFKHFFNLKSSDYENSAALAKIRAKFFYDAMIRLDRFYSEEHNKEPLMYGFGPRTTFDWEDHRLLRGVKARNLPSKDIYGRETPYFQNEDEIVLFNGIEVFGPEDLYMLLYDHAHSLNGGIKKSFSVGLRRGQSIIPYSVTHFFNPDYWENFEDTGTKAFIRGFWHSNTFGADAILTTILTQAGIWFLNNAAKVLEDKPGELGRIDYVNTAEFHWKFIQDTMRLSQMYPEEFSAGEMAGIISPSFGRGVIKKVVRSNDRIKAISRTSKLAREVLEEVLEEVIWNIATIPPSAEIDEILSDLKSDAMYGAGIGFAIGMIRK